MCGIAGVYRRDGEAGPGEVTPMLAAMLHRGPDDSGAWQAGRVALGHRRLSIIDLSPTGRQPMVSADGTGVIVYNGEVYNYPDLRRQLEADGAVFRGTSDTEVVLESLHRWGPERAIPLFDGMFAFAYFDRRGGVLWLARDRLGIKQVFVADRGSELVFASEVKGVLAHPRLAARIDRAALMRSFAVKLRGHQTLFEGVEGLLPGSWWRIDATGVTRHRYYHVLTALDPERLAAATRAGATEDLVTALRDALTGSVRSHLVSDAPLAAMCSGGVDSSLIAAYAKDDVPGIVGYVADAPVGSGEAAQAERVGRHLGIPIRTIPVDREAMLRLWPLACRHLDGPANHMSDPALLAVARACRADGIKVLLTGEGADELLGGYPYHRSAFRTWWRREWTMRLLPASAWERAARRWRMFPGLRIGGSDDTANQLRLAAAFGPDEAMTTRSFFERTAPLDSVADRAFFAACAADLYGHMSWLLRRHDHMGMAASIEMRVPFLENRLIDLAIHLPRKAKFQRRQGKWVEKQAALDRLPRDIVFARKKGFPMPAAYFRGTERLLAGGTVADLLGWSAGATETLVGELRYQPEFRYLLVGTELWLRQRLLNESVETQGERLLALAA